MVYVAFSISLLIRLEGGVNLLKNLFSYWHRPPQKKKIYRIKTNQKSIHTPRVILYERDCWFLIRTNMMRAQLENEKNIAHSKGSESFARFKFFWNMHILPWKFQTGIWNHLVLFWVRSETYTDHIILLSYGVESKLILILLLCPWQ